MFVRGSRYLIYSVLVLTAFVIPGVAMAASDVDHVHTTMLKLNREASTPESAAMIAELIGVEYGTPVYEMEWAVAHQLSWGDIAAFAYIRATTGRTFAELDVAEVRTDLPGYAEKTGMDTSKMVRSLDQFLKRAEKERNSRIFDQLRYAERVSSIPDLGSGFGLFQQALDFRNIEVPSLTKTHTVGNGTVKGQ